MVPNNGKKAAVARPSRSFSAPVPRPSEAEVDQYAAASSNAPALSRSSRKSGNAVLEKLIRVPRSVGLENWMRVSRPSGSWTPGGGRRRSRSMTPNMVALAAMPRARVMLTPIANSGSRTSPRTACRTSWSRPPAHSRRRCCAACDVSMACRDVRCLVMSPNLRSASSRAAAGVRPRPINSSVTRSRWNAISSSSSASTRGRWVVRRNRRRMPGGRSEDMRQAVWSTLNTAAA